MTCLRSSSAAGSFSNSNTREVPMPITGSMKPVCGTLRFRIGVCAKLAWGNNVAAAVVASTVRRDRSVMACLLSGGLRFGGLKGGALFLHAAQEQAEARPAQHEGDGERGDGGNAHHQRPGEKIEQPSPPHAGAAGGDPVHPL